MSQFTTVRGVNPDVAESTILLDTREAVRVDDRVDGVADAVIEGDLVVLVTPVGNATRASIYVNEQPVANAWPVEKAEKEAKRVVKLVKKGKTADEIEAIINE